MSERSRAREREKLERFERVKAEMAEQGYTGTECTISVLRANVLAFVTAGPFALAVIVLYVLRWGGMEIAFTPGGYGLWVAALLVSIPVHEALHGLGWHWFTSDGWRSIHFGMMWKYLTPYCHCAQPLDRRGYLIGGLLPFVVLGLGISVLGIWIGNAPVMLLGAVSILAAGGDTTLMWMLRRYPNCLFYDHPTECGFVVFQSEK
ncbi:MAG: DUF3267 domain-containing protein [Butyricicoccaceae bacterium]